MTLEGDWYNLYQETVVDTLPVCRRIEETARINTEKVLRAMQKARVSDFHLKGSSGYGYNDLAREALEEVYAGVFSSEAALVRSQIVSGTHAIALCLYGVLRPGDELLAVQGAPYDTLAAIIGINGRESGCLQEYGITYRQVELLPDGSPDYQAIKQAINSRTRMVMLQRSRGYSLRPALTIDRMKELIDFIRAQKSDVVIFVDNCYGEFVEEREPTEIGADLVAGSLIKNPGGGLAPTGGYVAGRHKYVEMAASRWSAPGIGREVGPSPDYVRLLFQGIFLAPSFVGEALQGMVFAARLFERLGYDTYPGYMEDRSDIIQAVVLNSPRKVIAFCQAIQASSPVDAHVRPEPVDMPGYADPVIMAAGTFIQGASLELSADAPMRPPYTVYLQGGLSRHHTRLAVIQAARALENLQGA